MSEKEQLEAINLLREWLDAVGRSAEGAANHGGPPDPDALVTVIDKTQKFLNFGGGPESHGQRRS